MSEEEGERDGGRTDIYAPDSDWDSDLGTETNYTIDGDRVAGICVNDWLDVNPDALPQDPQWGSSFQVYQCDPEAVLVRFYNASTDLYEITTVSPAWISNVFRKVPTT